MTGTSSLLGFLGFQVAWLAAAVGAARGYAWPGPVAMAALLAGEIARNDRPGRLAVLAVVCALAGAIVESALVAGGGLRYAAAVPRLGLAPLWVVALWAGFAVTLDALGGSLGRRPLPIAALLGAALGPLAYIAGARLEALVMPAPAWPALAGIALAWAASLPALVAVASRLR